MNQTLIGICGFLCMAAIMLSLFKSKTVPAVAFVLFPTILGIFLMMWEEVTIALQTSAT